MGKDWDKALPDKQIWRECYRVLKDGAFAFVMSIPRADCLSRMIINLEDAGFRVNFTPIFWAYASGFPKAQNIGKAVDKRLEWGSPETFGKLCKDKREVLGLTVGQADKLINGGTGNYRIWVEGTHHRTGKPQRLPRWNEYLKIKEVLGLDDTWDKCMQEAEREVIGKGQAGLGKNIPAHEGGYKPEYNLTMSATPQAKALDGSYGGFQPKPAVEVIIVAMKPLSEKTFVDQALKNKKGITWLDEGRIPHDEPIKEMKAQGLDTGNQTFGQGGRYEPTTELKVFGRFPANLLTSDSTLDYNRGVCINEGNIQTVESDLNRGEVGIRAKAKPLGMPFFTEGLEVKKQDGESPKHLKGNPNLQKPNLPCQKQDLTSMTNEAEKSEEVMLDEELITDGEGQSLRETITLAKNVDTRARVAGAEDYTPIISKPMQSIPNSGTRFPTEKHFASLATGKQKTSDSKDNFSRYFSLDSWWEDRIKLLPESVQKTFPFLIAPKASKSEKGKGCEEMYWLDEEQIESELYFTLKEENERLPLSERFKIAQGNIHPTVKPLKLMSYLITLGSREGDTVLDNFMGSGTTCVSARMLGRKCIGIDSKEETCEIAALRCCQV